MLNETSKYALITGATKGIGYELAKLFANDGYTLVIVAVGQFFDKGIILKGGQAPAQKHIDKLMKYVSEGKVILEDIITHRLPLSEISKGYSIFKKKEDNCVKVVLDPWA